MPRFAANLSYLFTEAPFVERFQLAADAGFRAVEFHFPYAHDAAVLAEAARRAGVELVLFNLYPGDWEKGDRGIACDPVRVGEFRDSLARSIDYARALGCSRMNCLSGVAPVGVPLAAVREAYVGNLRHAAAQLERAGLTLLIEPINTRSIPGNFLNTSAQAIGIMDEVAAPNLLLQYDLFHMQIMEGDLAMTLQRLLPRIGHVQIADVPGRHEPGTGEINFAFLFDWMDRIGYTGWVGCEYAPAAGTGAGLGWVRPWLARG
jgi:hydroxypyruvate isomerase